MKTIFITVFQPFISRNILNTGVFDNLLLHEDVKIILFVPHQKEAYYKQTYTHERVVVIGIDVQKNLSKKDKIFKNSADLLIDTNTKKFHKMIDLFTTHRTLKYYFSIWFTKLFSHSHTIKKYFRYLEKKINHTSLFQLYFDTYKPTVVFTPDVFNDGDIAMLKAAQKNKVRNVGMVLSWDNNTSKGLMRVIPEKLIVQNEIIKEESVSIQDVDPRFIVISGIAHYDYYKQYKPLSREEYFKKIGKDPHKKVVLISPAGQKFISTDWHIFQILKDAYAEGKIHHDVVFLVRVHPTNGIDFGTFTPDENFIIETPGVGFQGVRAKDNELTKDNVHHLIDTITHSGVVLNVLSSIIIDASVLDIPTITIGFDGFEKKPPFERSVQLYLEEENMAKLLGVGATPVVQNKDELITWINRYLDDPLLHQEERSELVKRQCWRLDGKAAERIVEYILHEK